MALPDITELTVSELEELVKQCTSQIESRKKSKRRELARTFRQLARTEGLELTDIIEESTASAARKRRPTKATTKKAGRKKTRGKVAPKYRNPDNSAKTWTGRGRTPLWVVAALESGKELQDLAIK